MIFTGAAKRLADSDLPRIGHMIGVGEDELHAFLEVETSGGGFDAHGRPKMLFEPHRFYANLSGTKRALAVKGGLAYPVWGSKPYPKDSYPRLVAAIAIDETAALRSASWGIGQIMGENHVDAGYVSPQAMVAAFLDGEAEQLEAAVRFIKANHLDDELRAHNWAALARGYNGPQYAKNGYHTKLAAAFKKWAAIRDTPWAPEPAVTLALAVAATDDDPVIVKPVLASAATCGTCGKALAA
jgi:hypothetical protein